MRRNVALFGAAMFCVGCFSLYLMLESSTNIPKVMSEKDVSLKIN